MPESTRRATRVAAYCEAPTCSTGFGNASRHILGLLQATGRYEIEVIGVNYLGEPHELPFRIWPACVSGKGDPFGRKRAEALIRQLDFDLLFFFQDAYILDFVPGVIERLRRERHRPFRSIGYYPIDMILAEDWARNLAPMDHLVCYAEFARRLSLQALPARDDIEVIPHGIDPSDFYPIPERDRVEAFRRAYFGEQAGHFIVTNVNRNQPRKDIPRTVRAFRRLKEQVPASLLYLHMAPKDFGWDLAELCRGQGLEIGRDVQFPQRLSTYHGVKRDVLNLIYNASDLVISTSLGEGFGLSWAEAMAAGTPVVMPRHSAMAELISDETGYLIDNGTNDSLWTVLPGDGGVERPLVDVDHLVATLRQVHDNQAEAAAKAAAAYHWVTAELDWNRRIRTQWLDLFERASAAVRKAATRSDARATGLIDAILI